uniref:Alternative protein ABCA13 n=1 Tax=Homo sapiens TaxID=9606 RepID=L8E9N5_HUMAN|nr:alternative protein ABCA13 [Homo sapiens]
MSMGSCLLPFMAKWPVYLIISTCLPKVKIHHVQMKAPEWK